MIKRVLLDIEKGMKLNSKVSIPARISAVSAISLYAQKNPIYFCRLLDLE